MVRFWIHISKQNCTDRICCQNRGTWLAQLVEHVTPDLGTFKFEPHTGDRVYLRKIYTHTHTQKKEKGFGARVDLGSKKTVKAKG